MGIELFNFLSSDIQTLKKIYDYENLDITDIGCEQFLINFNKITQQIHITSELPDCFFKRQAEMKLYDFNEYLKAEMELKYENWLTSE